MVILINGVPSGGGSGGGASLPTAPLGQVLISQGDGVPPIFSAAPVATSGWHTTSADYNSYACTVHEGALRAVKVHPYERTYAGITAGEFVGELANISDSTVSTIGAVIAGGGAFNVLARWNGTNWIVVSGNGQEVQLYNPTGGAGTRRWRMFIDAGGDLLLDSLTDAGVSYGRPLLISVFNGGIQSWGPIIAQGSMSCSDLGVIERPFAGLPGVPSVGHLANIQDSTVNTIGATVAGGGTFHVLARYNGTIWKVIGI